MLVSCYSKPLQCSLKKPQIKHDFFKNEGVILEKLIQVNLELVFFCDFYFLPTEFRAWKAKNLLNLAREFCRNFVEQNLNENKSSGVLPSSTEFYQVLPSSIQFWPMFY